VHHDFNIRKLMTEAIASSALTPRQPRLKGTEGPPIPLASGH
jgi:hypothetical protein